MRYSCGCVRKATGEYDLSGQTFGRLTAIELTTHRGWHCVCTECGEDEFHPRWEIEVAGKWPCPNVQEDERQYHMHRIKIVPPNGEISYAELNAISARDALEQVKNHTEFRIVY